MHLRKHQGGLRGGIRYGTDGITCRNKTRVENEGGAMANSGRDVYIEPQHGSQIRVKWGRMERSMGYGKEGNGSGREATLRTVLAVVGVG